MVASRVWAGAAVVSCACAEAASQSAPGCLESESVNLSAVPNCDAVPIDQKPEVEEVEEQRKEEDL